MTVLADLTAGTIATGITVDTPIGIVIYEAGAAILTGRIIFQMTDQTEIDTAGAALVAAIKAPVANETVAIATCVTSTAIRAVLLGINTAIMAHTTVGAPFVYTFAAKSAALAIVITHETIAAIGTMAIVIDSAVDAQMAIIAPVAVIPTAAAL